MKEITVCIVDDNNELRSALQEIVSMAEGFKCTGTMSNASEAIANLPLLKPDVVLMDMMMPKYDGLYGLEHIKNIVPDAKIIILTADQTDETRTKLKKMNHDLIILKPVDINKLVQMINE